MTNEETDKSVSSDELLARFILFKSHMRQDWTVRPDAFIPYPWPDLSVTRHLQLQDSELWKIGQTVAQVSKKILHGRADFSASVARKHKLSVVADPVPDNPNHAIISGWPLDKPSQKSIAQEISASAGKARITPVDMD